MGKHGVADTCREGRGQEVEESLFQSQRNPHGSGGGGELGLQYLTLLDP